MALLLGPIIGLVTDSTARVLVESNLDETLELAVRVDRAGAKTRLLSLAVQRLRPAAFAIDGLVAGTRYAIQVRSPSGPWTDGAFRTVDPGASRFTALTVSCSRITEAIEPIGWRSVARRVADKKKPVDVLLHLGDQVYGDARLASGKSTIERCLERLQHTPRPEWPALTAWITEMYRALYRHSWREDTVAHVLARVPNLMIWDDHEIGDDWGDDNKFADPTSAHHHVARGAWKAFHEYQRQLWDPGALAARPGELETYHQVLGPAGVLFLDLRGGRGFVRYDREASAPPAGRRLPMLGEEQWNRIDAALAGPLKDVKLLVIAASVPVAFMGPDWTDAHLLLEDDVRGHWSFRLNQGEQERLLRTLSIWRQSRPGADVVIVSGDVHLGCRTIIQHTRNKSIIQQLISSPIHRQPLGKVAMTGFTSLIVPGPNNRQTSRPEELFTWKPGATTSAMNYGQVTASFAANKRPTLDLVVVKATRT